MRIRRHRGSVALRKLTPGLLTVVMLTLSAFAVPPSPDGNGAPHPGPGSLAALLPPPDPTPVEASGAAGFPPGYTGYHTYPELITELGMLVTAHPARVAVSSYGRSVQGRPLPLVKISDNVGRDEDEPEVLFTCGLHGREHLTVEMCLHIARHLAEQPARVRDREVWVMPMTNPDGAMYDTAGKDFARWRKNRQPNPDGTVGTDLNRNWATKWGCCGGSSGEPGAPDYRGSAPFSAPETAALAAWVQSRVIDGEQQVTAHIDWHSYGEMVLWPYGYTTANTASGMDAAEAAAFRALGQAMAAAIGYAPMQVSDLYITDGLMNDWMWAEHGIWSFTIEMYPDSADGGGFYPPDSVIDRQTARADAAVNLLLRYAHCVPCAAARSATPTAPSSPSSRPSANAAS